MDIFVDECGVLVDADEYDAEKVDVEGRMVESGVTLNGN